jgi:hypothetical protein
MKIIRSIIKYVFYSFLILVFFLAILSYKKNPTHITYGVTFSKFYSDQLNLPFQSTYISILDELKVKKLRLVAYWQLIEPQKDSYDFADLDFQVIEAQKRNAEVILAVGRRVPRWPECHIPDWAKKMSWEDQKKEILAYLEKTVERYKGYSNIKYWQVENEPYLTIFSKENCGELDQIFLREEIALVKRLDPGRPILVTDSGNLGLWNGAWRAGDIFGTSVYMYLWNPEIGQVKSIYLPSFYKAKTNLMSLIYGNKPNLLIELSLEPWLIEPITEAPIETQLARMDINKFNEVINFAKQTGFDEQYLWGVEWWYWMQNKGHPEFWENAKSLFP